MSVKLRQRRNKDGTQSLRLDIIHGGRRWVETLPLKLTGTNDKDTKELAKKIAVKRAAELAAADYGISADPRKTEAVQWMQDYIDRYTKSDKKNLQAALNNFEAFAGRVPFSRVTEQLVAGYQDYLSGKFTGEGISSYFNRFKKMLKAAYSARVIPYYPFVKTKSSPAKVRDTLTIDEIQALARTPCPNDQVKKAFLFCCVTGLRFCDVKTLKFSDIRGGVLVKEQAKVSRQVVINLNDTAKKLAGEGAGLVFLLPTANGSNKILKQWVGKAGVNKVITWHCARHSFGTNLIFNGADVLTASSLLGHASLKHTQRYVRAAAELKQRATDTLNFDL